MGIIGFSSPPQRRSHEPDLVLAVGVSGVGVARHDEGIVDTHTWRVQNLCHGADLIHDGHFVGGSSERPER